MLLEFDNKKSLSAWDLHFFIKIRMMLHGGKTVEGIIQILCNAILGRPEMMSSFFIGKGNWICDMPDKFWEVFFVI
jgi:hypothetical protein